MLSVLYFRHLLVAILQCNSQSGCTRIGRYYIFRKFFFLFGFPIPRFNFLCISFWNLSVLSECFILFSSISWPNHFVWLMTNSDFLLTARYPAFSSLLRISSIFFSCSCLFPWVTTITSSNQAGAQYPSVR